MAKQITKGQIPATGNAFHVTRRGLPWAVAGLTAGTWYGWNAVTGSPAHAQAASGQLRTPLTSADFHIHSGHSLTDAYAAWHMNMRELLISAGVRQAYSRMINSTMPGSSMAARWDHVFDDSRAAGGIGADARRNIADFQSLIITQSGPPPRFKHPGESEDWQRSTLDYLCRFAANTLVHGNKGQGAQDIILWSIWPATDMWTTEPRGTPDPWKDMSFRDALVEYGRIFKYMADYTTWKMHQTYPSLPADWRVWIFPGHLFMLHLHDDIDAGVAPGYATIDDAFDDTIHPDMKTNYGLTVLMSALLYGFDFEAMAAGRSRVFIDPNATREQAGYFWKLANRIAAEYEPAGRGGTLGGEIAFDPATDPDLLADWTFDGTDVFTGAPDASDIPTISGDPVIGGALVASGPEWVGYPAPDRITGTWERSTDGTTWEAIGDSAETLRLEFAHVGHLLRYSISATNTAGTSTVSSDPVGPVLDDAEAILPPRPAVHWNATAYQGPQRDGTLPTVMDGGFLRFSRVADHTQVCRTPLAATELYICVAVRADGPGILEPVSASAGPWSYDMPNKILKLFPHSGSHIRAQLDRDGEATVAAEGPEASYQTGVWHVAEALFEQDRVTVRIIRPDTRLDSGDRSAEFTGPLPGTNAVFLSPTYGPGDPIALDMSEIVIYDRIPTAQERANIRAVVTESIPG